MRKLLVAGTAMLVALSATACTDTYLGRMLALRGVDVEDYRRLPSRPVANAPGSSPLPTALDPAWMTRVLPDELASAQRFDAFAERHGTTAFLILADGRLVDERYYGGAGRDSVQKLLDLEVGPVSLVRHRDGRRDHQS
jgi:hypothetical protein